MNLIDFSLILTVNQEQEVADNFLVTVMHCFIKKYFGSNKLTHSAERFLLLLYFYTKSPKEMFSCELATSLVQ